MRKYFLVPIHSTPLLLVVVFSVGQLLAIKAGFMGIPLGLLLFSWFFKYCFVLFDSVVAGEDEPPVLDIDMVNPISEQRPLVLAVLVVAEVMLVAALQKSAGPLIGLLVAVVLSWVLPAHIAVLGYTRNVAKALWPPDLLTLIRALGRNYALLNGAMLVAAGLVYWMATHGTALFPALVTAQLLLLLSFALVAGAMFEHRLALGIDSRTRQERMAERAAREHGAERARMLDMAYSRFRVRKPLEGWQEIEAWLRLHAQGDNQLSEYRAVLQAASEWDDVRAADKLANEFLAILLARRANGEAVIVVEQRLNTNPHYQVLPAPVATRIAELAGLAGKKSLQRRLRPQNG